MLDTRQARDPRTVKAEEAMNAKDERHEALIEYVAMMADVELPEEVVDEQVRAEG